MVIEKHIAQGKLLVNVHTKHTLALDSHSKIHVQTVYLKIPCHQYSHISFKLSDHPAKLLTTAHE